MKLFRLWIIPIVIAFFITCVLFWQFFIKGLIPIPSSFMVSWYEPWKTEFSINGVPSIPHKAVADDIFRQIYPLKTLAADLLRSGQLPLWNPYNGAGQPLLATLHTGIANPFSLTLLLNDTIGWTWYIILQLPILFFVTYLYLRAIKVSSFGSLISALTISLSGVVVTRLVYGDYIYAFICLPLLLLCIERKWFMPISLVVAFLSVVVQPQISFYILSVVIVYAIVRLKKMRLYFYGMILVGIGIAAFQLIPTIDLYLSANVTASSSKFIFQNFLVPVSQLVTIVIPNYFGNPGTYNFWGYADYVETISSMGMIPIALAFMAFFIKGKSKHLSSIASLSTWGILITVICTLHWIGPQLLYRLPIPIISTSIPTRIYLLTSFFIAVLAGIGADKFNRKSVIRSMVIVGGIGVSVFLGTLVLMRIESFPCPTQVPHCVMVALRNTVFELLVFVVGGVLLLISRIKYGLIFILIGVGMYNGWKFLPMSPASYVKRENPVLMQFASLAPNRIAGIGSASFATDFATQYRYFDTNYYDPLYIKRYGELVSYVNTGDPLKGLSRSDVNIISDATVSAEIQFRRDRFWDMTGTSALVTKKSDQVPSTMDILWEDVNWQIMNRSSVLPRAYLITNVLHIPDKDMELASLFSSEIDITKTAFTEVQVDGVDVGREVQGNARITSYKANEIYIDVDTSVSSLLVFSDTYHSGWKVKVDGVDSQAYRTNYAFRGVVVPKGRHIILWYYDPDSFKIGIVISITSLIVWMIVSYVLLRKSKGKKSLVS